MNTILKTIKLDGGFGEKLKAINVLKNPSALELVFERSIVKISDHHDQDCCEAVYADLEDINLYKNSLIDNYYGYKELIIKGVEDVGFLLCFMKNNEEGEKILIPCHNEQNGYYSDGLDLIVEHNGERETFDIGKYKNNRIS